VPQRLDPRAFAALDALLQNPAVGGASQYTGARRSLRRIK
jgi:hypothetical protein